MTEEIKTKKNQEKDKKNQQPRGGGRLIATFTAVLVFLVLVCSFATSGWTAASLPRESRVRRYNNVIIDKHNKHNGPDVRMIPLGEPTKMKELERLVLDDNSGHIARLTTRKTQEIVAQVEGGPRIRVPFERMALFVAAPEKAKNEQEEGPLMPVVSMVEDRAFAAFAASVTHSLGEALVRDIETLFGTKEARKVRDGMSRMSVLLLDDTVYKSWGSGIEFNRTKYAGYYTIRCDLLHMLPIATWLKQFFPNEDIESYIMDTSDAPYILVTMKGGGRYMMRNRRWALGLLLHEFAHHVDHIMWDLSKKYQKDAWDLHARLEKILPEREKSRYIMTKRMHPDRQWFYLKEEERPSELLTEASAYLAGAHYLCNTNGPGMRDLLVGELEPFVGKWFPQTLDEMRRATVGVSLLAGSLEPLKSKEAVLLSNSTTKQIPEVRAYKKWKSGLPLKYIQEKYRF
jgi:hypothetical protein